MAQENLLVGKVLEMEISVKWSLTVADKLGISTEKAFEAKWLEWVI